MGEEPRGVVACFAINFFPLSEYRLPIRTTTGAPMKRQGQQAFLATLLDVGRSARNKYRSVGYWRAQRKPPFGTRPPLKLAVCAIFRDEARYMPEWVAFHRVQGVERFYLYDNGSTDDWRTELAPEIASGIVEVRHPPSAPGQLSAYEDCLTRNRRSARWIAFIDIDEFLFSPTGKPLPEVLSAFDRHPGVVVNWRVFGTNGWKHPPEGLVIENYPMRATDDHPANALVKSIVYPRKAIATFLSAHYFRLHGNPVDENGVPALLHERHGSGELLRINHYYAKSETEFRRKASRPNPTDGTIQPRFGVPEDAIYDDTILQFVPRVKQALALRLTS